VKVMSKRQTDVDNKPNHFRRTHYSQICQSMLYTNFNERSCYPK